MSLFAHQKPSSILLADKIGQRVRRGLSLLPALRLTRFLARDDASSKAEAIDYPLDHAAPGLVARAVIEGGLSLAIARTVTAGAYVAL